MIAGWAEYADGCTEECASTHTDLPLSTTKKEADALFDMYQRFGAIDDMSEDDINMVVDNVIKPFLFGGAH